MRISPVINNNYIPAFKSTTRTTYISNSDGIFVLPSFNEDVNKNIAFATRPDVRMIVSNSTSFFRKDLPWADIGKIFHRQFPQGKVNIYDFGCSDGSEAYSLAIALIEQLGYENAKRYFPIKASDVDSEIVKTANSGKIIATDDDILSIKNIMQDDNVGKYFEITPCSNKKYILSPKEILTNNIVFEQKNISAGLDEINKDENNIVLCRNFWKYLTRNNMSDASWKLLDKLSDNTLVVIGNFDLYHCEETPLFMRAIGLDSLNNNKEQRNILSFDRNRINYFAARDKEMWNKYVSAYFPKYVPSYIS